MRLRAPALLAAAALTVGLLAAPPAAAVSLGEAGAPTTATLATAGNAAAITRAAASAHRAGRRGMTPPDPYFPSYGNSGYDVRHYAIRDDYDSRSGKLTGRTTIRAVATASRRTLSLDLVLQPLAVRVDGVPARFRQLHGRKLLVTPRRPFAKGREFRVSVRYKGVPERITRGGVAPWLTDGRETVAVGEPEICAWWFACNDHPRDKATYDITIRVPRGRQAISNGLLVSRTTTARRTSWHWRMVEPMASYLAFFAAGRFVVERSTAGGLPVLLAVSSQLRGADRAGALRLLRRTPEVVSWLSGRFGRYPFRAMGGVITSLYTGFALENQSRPVYPYLADDAEGRSVVVHELAHQWFGDAVSVDTWRDIWLNEGFATYAEWLYSEGHAGRSVADTLKAEYARRPASARFWRLRIGDPGRDHVFDNAVYDRGGMTLAALANRIGAANLASVLREWVAKHRYGNADIADFVSLAEAVSGQDLRSFFTAWLYTGAKPAATAANGLA